ncbi:hypothetical protein D3874_22830 [Oleomonas cavernae]|uniref:Cytochrome C oxidase subunit IV n=1 Tax=Oleomonas cavernae TaxID=2320859 RepID=A0A418WHI7_9PROT|nr:cytochrome C oxidase subunit IV family protein [Oleomonas cavernae]RJF89455.1 hypothetical protein D3874_22830 [Oleomonas cavernae]
MKAIVLGPITAVWLILVAVTGLSGWLYENEYGVAWAAAVILVFASLKILLIMAYFMELKGAPAAWRVAMGCWLAAVTVAVLSGGLVPAL